MGMAAEWLRWNAAKNAVRVNLYYSGAWAHDGPFLLTGDPRQRMANWCSRRGSVTGLLSWHSTMPALDKIAAATLKPIPVQDHVLFVADAIGTAVFAIEGAGAAFAANLDLFGVLVLSFTTALVGGIVRDVLLGCTPPASLRDWRYPAIAFAAGASAFFFHQYVVRIPSPALIALDAAGLGLFAVSGAAKAIEFKVPPLIAILLGTLTGVGGGVVRDLLLAQVPHILQSDIYATAALFGAALLVGGLRFGLPRGPMMFAGAAGCFVLRIVAVVQDWQLPRLHGN